MPSNSDSHREVTSASAAHITHEPGRGVHEVDECGEQVERVVPPPPRELIEVEFSKVDPFGVETFDFDNNREKPGKDLPCDWEESGLTRILRNNNLVSWKPSFPLQHPWSRKCSKKEALDRYIKEGRQKFVTFKFSREADVLSIAEQLRESPDIDKAVAVPQIAPPSQALEEPLTGDSDQLMLDCSPEGCLTKQWYLFRCGVPEAWAKPASGNGVVIADIDWGFDLTHRDLSHTELSRNVIRNSSNVADGNLLWHGNGVLGLAGAAANERGMAGVAFNATLWAIQAGTGAINRPVVDHEFWVNAIEFVRETPASGRKVIILELQTAGYSNPEMILSLRREIAAAINDGIVVCLPAGNGNPSGDAGLDDFGNLIEDTGAIVVGATRFDPERNIRAGSNGGPRVTVYAPGDSDSDLTCGLRNEYRDNFGGTSGATAKVAGVVALMLERNNSLTPLQVREILARSRKPVVDEDNNEVGVLVDANQAVTDAISMRSTAGGTLAAARMDQAA